MKKNYFCKIKATETLGRAYTDMRMRMYAPTLHMQASCMHTHASCMCTHVRVLEAMKGKFLH